MITAKRLGSYALIAAGLALAPSISAQTINVGAGLNGEASIGQVRATSSTGANVNVNTNIRPTSSPAGFSATSTATGSATVQTSTGTPTVTATTAASVEAAIDVSRSDVEDEQYASMSPSEVSTSADLGAYVRSLVQSDENVYRASAGEESVSLWYKDRAELLGFIPVTVSAKATVAADGTVEVSYPWYGFLTAYDSDGLEGDLDVTAGSIARAEGTTSLSAAAQARILNAMKAAMQANYESNLETDAGATSSGEVEIE